MRLDPQQSINVEIRAREKWNDTGVQVSAGESYLFAATGQWDDASHTCGPDGYPSPNFILRAAERLRRVPAAPWFALIGAVNQDSATTFFIGKGITRAFNGNGSLSCFANDVSFMYWNNRGSVELKITRIS